MAEREDILVEPGSPTAAEPPLRAKLAAFVPLTFAILGVAAILLGGISARHDRTTAAVPAVDGMATGSIAAE